MGLCHGISRQLSLLEILDKPAKSAENRVAFPDYRRDILVRCAQWLGKTGLSKAQLNCKEVNAMKGVQVILVILTLFAGTISAAYADCRKDGKTHPTGTVIDGFVCTADGKWVRK
jgi:hypothetical protein